MEAVDSFLYVRGVDRLNIEDRVWDRGSWSAGRGGGVGSIFTL